MPMKLGAEHAEGIIQNLEITIYKNYKTKTETII